MQNNNYNYNNNPNYNQNYTNNPNYNQNYNLNQNYNNGYNNNYNQNYNNNYNFNPQQPYANQNQNYNIQMQPSRQQAPPTLVKEYDYEQQQPKYNNRPANNNNNYQRNDQGVEDYKQYNGFGSSAYNKIVGAPSGIFKQKDIRVQFVRKVLSIIFCQFLLTSLLCLASVFSDSYKEFLEEHYYILVISVVVSLVCMLILYCVRSQARKSPNNYILLFIFTLAESYSLSYICAFTEPGTVLLAAGITSLLVFCLTLYAVFTKNDITQKVNFIFYLAIAVIVLAIGGIFFRNRIINIVIAVAFLLLFSIFLVLDVQRLQGNRKFSYDIDDYVIAALDIYIDIIIIFKQLLYLLGGNN